MIHVKIVFNNTLLKERTFNDPDVFLRYLKSLVEGIEALKATDLNIVFKRIECTIFIAQEIEKR